MDRHFNDYVSMSDKLHRDAMQHGSDMLLRAITDLRMGVCPGTSPWPVKLPPDYGERPVRPAIVQDGRKKPRPANDQVRDMMARKMGAGEIAAALKISHQKATSIMQLVRNQRPPTDAQLMAKRDLWG